MAALLVEVTRSVTAANHPECQQEQGKYNLPALHALVEIITGRLLFHTNSLLLAILLGKFLPPLFQCSDYFFGQCRNRLVNLTNLSFAFLTVDLAVIQ